MYSLHCGISLRQLDSNNSVGSELAFLANDEKHFPNRISLIRFLALLPKHINSIFSSTLSYIRDQGVELDFTTLYGDGTVMEAHNSRHKVITKTNVERSNKKWNAINDDSNTSDEEKKKAEEKLAVNVERIKKLESLNRNSYGRTDEDCVLAKDKNKSYIAGYNAQFIEEGRHGLVVYCELSNLFPDGEAFKSMVGKIIDLYHPKQFVLDTGYDSPEILMLLSAGKCTPLVHTRKIENAKTSINEYSFELSDDESTLECPTGRILERTKCKNSEETRFKSASCDGCAIKEKCSPNVINKSVTIKLDQFKTLKELSRIIDSKEGAEVYSHRGNKCESPHGHIKYNLNGKKFQTTGIEKCDTILKLYAMLYNLRRMLTIVNSKG
jgi:hypothetical protein